MLPIPENFSSNTFYKSNEQMFLLLRNMYLHHTSFGAIFNKFYKGKPRSISPERLALQAWIISSTLQWMPTEDYSIWQRIEWILCDRHEFPRCKNPVCNKPLSEPKNFTTRYGYYDYCSELCVRSDPMTYEKGRQTRLEKNGGRFNSLESIQKAKRTFTKHYGVDNNMKSEVGLAEYCFAMKKKYGVCFNFQREDFKEIQHATKQERYGNPTFNNPEKHQQTNIANGHSANWNNPEQIVATKLQKKKDDPNYVSRRNEIYRNTSLERFGYENPMQSPEVQAKAKRKYVYNGISFDSKPEIAFYIWLSDFNVKFVFHPKVNFTYQFEGATFFYSPDYYLIEQNLYVEIKGNHFFKNGDTTLQMICPYRYKSWSDADYEKACQRYEAKHQCMLKNHVKILTGKDYAKYVQYVKVKYGSKYLSNFKVT